MSQPAITLELKELVSQSVKILGQAIQEVHGTKLYNEVENLRVRMKALRSGEGQKVYQELNAVYEELNSKKDLEIYKVAKSFSLMLELINSCEAAYRTFRLQEQKFNPTVTPHSLVFVFTSHPTEARSRNFLELTDKIEALLLHSLHERMDVIRDQLYYLLKIALRLDLANNKKPQVKDEAEQIFHTVMNEKIISEQVDLHLKGINVFFRTWVGGDKDGNPKVGPSTMIESMNLSRTKLSSFITHKLGSLASDLKLLHSTNETYKKLTITKAILAELKSVKEADGKKIVKFKKSLEALKVAAEKEHFNGPALKEIEALLWLYPSLVVPLEIREDSSLIHEALKDKTLNIAQMLLTLKKIASGMDAKWYVRGFVISMCQTTEDMMAAVKLTIKMTGSLTIPVVPLFENAKGLENSISILEESFKTFPFTTHHHKNWGGRFEVMLGYSDSSKENGVLPGRLMVERALLNLESFLLKHKLVPVFFHGSGGSVSRGGGSIKEQIAWWPETALNIYKVTVQGETVQRHFHHPLIMKSQVMKIVEGFANYKAKKRVESKELMVFAKKTQEAYRELVEDTSFQEMTSHATPYDFLNLLKIGSRPTKRTGKGKFTLRAIPWILCWTQTRILLPVWWGVGSSWKEMTSEEKDKIKKASHESPLLESYIKNLGFTLSKIEIGVWRFQLEKSKLSSDEKEKWFKKVNEELKLTEIFFKDIMGHNDYTWYNKRLGESIVYRSSMIHPLNVIQKIALERNNSVLLRETVTGIACGMLTTG